MRAREEGVVVSRSPMEWRALLARLLIDAPTEGVVLPASAAGGGSGVCARSSVLPLVTLLSWEWYLGQGQG